MISPRGACFTYCYCWCAEDTAAPVVQYCHLQCMIFPVHAAPVVQLSSLVYALHCNTAPVVQDCHLQCMLFTVQAAPVVQLSSSAYALHCNTAPVVQYCHLQCMLFTVQASPVVQLSSSVYAVHCINFIQIQRESTYFVHKHLFCYISYKV